MRYDFFAWADGSGSCVHSGEFSSDEDALTFAASLPPEFSYTVEELGNGYRRMIGEPAPASEPSGEPQGLTPAELAQMLESARLESLYTACIRWQSRPADPHTCDSNFFALLTSVSAVAKIAGVPVATKASACLAWLDTLWGDYYVRKATGSTDYNFSAHGGCPHSFLEVREEAGG